MNSQMRRIDIFCKLVSPLAIAFIDGFSTKIAILVILTINAACVLVEYALIAWTYWSVPSLGISSQKDEEPFKNARPAPSEAESGISYLLLSQYRQLLESVKIYTSQPAFLPSISLSFLYLTVLSFSGQMVTYLLATGFSSTTIGCIRTISVLTEISATWLAPKIMVKLGPTRAGMWFLSWQTICLSITVGVFWINWSPMWASSVLVTGVIASRGGLWGFDLSAQIIIQEVRFPSLNRQWTIVCMTCDWDARDTYTDADGGRKLSRSTEDHFRPWNLRCRTSSNSAPLPRQLYLLDRINSDIRH